MKASLNWVKEFTKVDLPVDKLVHKIGVQLGAVEEVIDLSKKYQGIIVAKVISCEKHPNADKLSVCLIDDSRKTKHVDRDSKGLVQVVCGAPNVKAGMLVAWLPPGATVPSSFDKDPFVLEAREIRGELSNGMLASANELAISDDHSGIVELNPDDAKPGDDFAKTYKLDDYIIDIENKMFTHRPDLFGILGLAREIAGIQSQRFKSPGWYLEPSKTSLKPDHKATKVTVKNSIPKFVPRFMAVPLSIAHNGPSPLWMQTYLSRVGLRPINTVVDITNYMMHLTGQPMHAYDADKLPSAGNLEVRMSKKNEKLQLLSGKELVLKDENTILITSGDKPVGVGGVMGGEETEVDENTKNIILECATFDMYTIRRTAMEYGLFTDAVTRFTKGQSALQNDRVMAKAIEIFKQLADAMVTGDVVDKHGKIVEPATVRVTPAFINERLGLSLSANKISSLLENVEFRVRLIGKQLAVKPPFWRTDIEIAEDVVEEVGRLYGYEHLPIELPKRYIKPTKRNSLFDRKSQIRDILSRAGANEVLSYSFVHWDLFTKVGQDPKNAFKLTNAISPDLHYYRQSLLPSLLDKVHGNVKTGFSQFALFEINQVHTKDLIDKDGLPIEEFRVSFVIVADDKAAQAYEGAAYYAARQYLDYLFSSLGIQAIYEPATTHEPKLAVGKAALAPFEPSRAAYAKTHEGQLLGEIGEFKADIRRKLKLPKYSAGFEIDVLRLHENASKKPQYYSLSKYPSVEQDMTLKVPRSTDYQEVDLALTRSSDNLADGDNLTIKRELLYIYQKDGDDHKNISFRFTVSSPSRTLTAPEVNELLDKIAADSNLERI